MTASSKHEAAHRSFGGLQQWNECVAFGWLSQYQARDSSCDRPIATDAAAQPVPPDDAYQPVAGHRRQAERSGWVGSASSPFPSAAPPAHCQPGGGAHGEQPDEPGPAALHDGDDPPQPHRDQEQTDAASQQAASKRTPRIAHHHHLLEDCELGTCLATADSLLYLLAVTAAAIAIASDIVGLRHRFCLVRPLAVPRHSKAGDTDVARYLVSPHCPGLV